MSKSMAGGIALMLLLGAGLANAKGGGNGGSTDFGISSQSGNSRGSGTCFQHCFDKCVNNMEVSNGSRIIQKCSNRCTMRCS